jgi:hypothetical protein
MDQQTLERLSEPFFTTKGNNGTGLGLWISYDILQKHQAIMRVRSRCKENKTGTIFPSFSLSMACNNGGLSSPKNDGPRNVSRHSPGRQQKFYCQKLKVPMG